MHVLVVKTLISPLDIGADENYIFFLYIYYLYYIPIIKTGYVLNLVDIIYCLGMSA